MTYREILKSEYGDSDNNFDVIKKDDSLIVNITYPNLISEANPHNKVRFIEIDQESVRASDGIRVHYDYNRDGFVICQPKNHLVKLESETYDTVTEWIETAFAQSWHFEDPNDDIAEAFKKADEEYARTHS